MTTPTLEQLRAQARLATLFPPTTLAGAVHRLGFVQADPIRAPARAQDLILRHRVSGYRAGALERSFVRLQLEEDFLYAYGFMPRRHAGPCCIPASTRTATPGCTRRPGSRPRCWSSCAPAAPPTRATWTRASAATAP